MLKCWSVNPDDRPLFSTLKKTFTDFISAKSVSVKLSYIRSMILHNHATDH